MFPEGMAEKRMLSRIPLGRVGAHQELADLTAFLLADQSGFINGETVTIDGGEWLKGAGQFSMMEELTDEMWEHMKQQGKG